MQTYTNVASICSDLKLQSLDHMETIGHIGLWSRESTGANLFWQVKLKTPCHTAKQN